MTGSLLFSVERGEQRPLPPAHASVAPSEPHRSLPVVPLIADKRYYGEAPVCIRRGSGQTPMRLPGIQRRVALGI